jgi:hypothetical protein
VRADSHTQLAARLHLFDPEWLEFWPPGLDSWLLTPPQNTGDRARDLAPEILRALPPVVRAG